MPDRVWAPEGLMGRHWGRTEDRMLEDEALKGSSPRLMELGGAHSRDGGATHSHGKAGGRKEE